MSPGTWLTFLRGTLPWLGAATLLMASTWVGLHQLALRRERARALPSYAGRLPVVGLEESVELLWDARGVPHVSATRERQAWLGLGTVHALDRLAQMLWLRRLASGEAAEVRGSDLVDADHLALLLGFSGHARARAAELDRGDRAVLEAYARGVNARLDQIARGEVGAPPEVLEWRVPIRPWTPEDSLAVYQLVSWVSSSSLEAAVVLSELIARLGGVGARPFSPGSGRVEGISLPAWRDQRVPPDVERASFRPRAWQVARIDGSAFALRTRSGTTLLGAQLSGPGTVPGLFYEAHLRSGDGQLAVWGATVPGIPGFVVGRNEAVAWSAAPARAAASDVYEETLSEDESRYHDGGRWRGLERREHAFAVRPTTGEGAPEVRRVGTRHTQHGPLVSDWLSSPRQPWAVGWTGAREGRGLETWIALARATSVAEVWGQLERHNHPPVAVTCADRFGEGGVRIAGWLPQRVLDTHLVPVPGRMRAFNWREPVDFAELPARRLGARPGAWVVSADEPLPPGHGATRVEWLWRSGARAASLDAALAEASDRPLLDVETAAAVLTDLREARAPELARQITRFEARHGLDPGDGGRELLTLLDRWDGVLDEAAPGPIVQRLVLFELADALFAADAGPRLWSRYQQLPWVEPGELALAALRESVAAGARGGWSDPKRVRAALEVGLGRAWARLRVLVGPSRDRWAWGRVHQLVLRPFSRPTAGPLGAGLPTGGGRDAAWRTEAAGAGSLEVSRAPLFLLVADMAVELEAPSALLTLHAPGQSELEYAPGSRVGLERWRGRSLAPSVGREAWENDPRSTRLVLEPEP